MRTFTGICCGALVATLLAPATAAQREDPIPLFEIEDGQPGWDGIRLGLSLVQAERRLGATLALAPRGARPVCSSFAAEAEHHGIRLTLGFRSARPGAKIESLWVRFEGQQVAASASDLVAALRRHAPAATYRADRERPALAEANDPTPTYLLSEDGLGAAVRLVPREGMLLAEPGCLG